MRLEPGDGTFDGGTDIRRGLLEAHQQAHDADRLAAAERGEFVGTGLGRREGLFVVLRAPHGGLPFDYDLALQDARDPALESLAAGLARLGVEEGVAVVAADLADEFQDADHGAVVKRDVVEVALAQGEELWPTAVRVLCLEHVSQAAVEGLTIGFSLRRVDHARHEAQLIDGTLVVKGRLEFGSVTDIRLAYGVGVLRPAPRVGLIAQDDVGDLLRLLAGEPSVRFAQVASRAVVGRQSGEEGKEREEEQGGAHGW